MLAFGLRPILWALLGLTAACASARANSSSGDRTLEADRYRTLDVGDQRTFWHDGRYVEMVPPIRVSVRAGENGRIVVMLHVPDGAEIDARRIDDQGRFSLDFPPGTIADRVAYVGPPGANRERLTVADVRGTRIALDGASVHHVYRPRSGAAFAPMVGFEWRDDRAEQSERAQRALIDHVSRTPGALARAAPSRDTVSFFARMNACGSCHERDEPEANHSWDASTPWATDGAGWFVPLAVLATDLPLSTTSTFHDPNADDRFVTARCGDVVAQPLGSPGAHFYRCPDHGVPLGRRDIRAGLAAGDAYTRAVCASRRYLHERMTPRARESFAARFRECDLSRRRALQRALRRVARSP